MPPIQEDGIEVDETQGKLEVAEPTRQEADESDQAESPSAFELVRRVLVGMVQAIEDGAELLGTSVREELRRFQTNLIRSLVATFLLAAGGGLVTAGLALLVHRWVGSWAVVLLVLGGLYLAVGAWLFLASAPEEDG